MRSFIDAGRLVLGRLVNQMNRRYTIYVSDNTTHTRQEGWYCGTELLGSSKYALKFDSIKAAEGKIGYMKKIQFSKQNSKILSDKEINEKLIDTFMHKAKIVSGCGGWYPIQNLMSIFGES